MGLGYVEPLISAQVDGTANTAGTAASAIPAAAKKTLPANYFDVIGKQLLIKASGRITSVITTPGTATYDIRFGATIVFNGGAILLDSVAAHTSVGWYLEILLTCRAIGTAGNLMGAGTWVCEDILGVPAAAPKGVLNAMLPWNTAPVVGTNFDTTATQQIDMFFANNVGTGSHQVHQFGVYGLN